MRCHSCSKIIELGLKDIEGVNSAVVRFDSTKAFLEFDPSKTNGIELKNAIANLGYAAIKE